MYGLGVKINIARWQPPTLPCLPLILTAYLYHLKTSSTSYFDLGWHNVALSCLCGLVVSEKAIREYSLVRDAPLDFKGGGGSRKFGSGQVFFFPPAWQG